MTKLPTTNADQNDMTEAKARMAVLDGASALFGTAAVLQASCAVAPGDYVVMRKKDLHEFARSICMTARLLDLLSLAVESGETLSSALGRRC